MKTNTKRCPTCRLNVDNLKSKLAYFTFKFNPSYATLPFKLQNLQMFIILKIAISIWLSFNQIQRICSFVNTTDHLALLYSCLEAYNVKWHNLNLFCIAFNLL